MKLQIDNEEELAIASDAIETFRRTQVRHIGKYVKCMDFPCHSSDRERAFADEWERQNQQVAGLNNGRGLLELLLCVNGDDRVTRNLTPEEATNAATVIQWLGTHCGFDFLNTCVGKFGYVIRQKGTA